MNSFMLSNMFTHKESIDQVYDYQLSDNGVYYISKKDEIIYYTNRQKELILALRSSCQLLLFKNKLYLSDCNKQLHNCCIDVKSKQIIYDFTANGVDLIDIYGGLESKKIGLIHANGDYSVYDIEQDKIIFTINAPISQVYLFGDYYTFFRSGKSNSLHCYVQSEKLWELDLSGYGRLKRIFGIVDNVLWLWCEDYYFIGVDFSSGSIKKVWEVFDGVYERGRFYFYYPYFDKEEGKIYFFERNCYVVSDLRSCTTRILWQEDQIKIKIICSTFSKEVIYFTCVIDALAGGNRLGVFDRRIMQIIWMEKLDLTPGDSLWAPRFNDNKLYVQDSGYTLHIYEKSDLPLS